MHFEKISTDLDNALTRHAQAPKTSTKNHGIGTSGSANYALASVALSSSQGMQADCKFHSCPLSCCQNSRVCRNSFLYAAVVLSTAYDPIGMLSNAGPDETSNVLIATRSCFRYTALDHLNILSVVQAKKRHEILDPVRTS